MWTPRRILIFVTALIGFLGVFGVYALLVIVDGLPPLPQQYLPGDAPPLLNLSDIEDLRERLIRHAFGNECDELKRLSRAYLATKGVVLAINKFEIVDGRVKLMPFSAGLFGKEKPGQRFPEINTIQCAEAYLTLDRPVTSLTELSRSKVIAAELCGPGGVKIINNRATPGKSDDLIVLIPDGRLFFEDARNLIWTESYVKLLDTQTQPLPTEITAVGLDIQLSKDVSPNREKKTAPAKSDRPGDAISGVEQIRLRGNVDMHLYVDARPGFLGSSGEPRQAPPSAAPLEKAHVHIKTNGPFVYDLLKKSARFDAPRTKNALPHDRVLVTRHAKAQRKPGEVVQSDQIECDHLDIQFRDKSTQAKDKSTAPPTKTDQTKSEIDSSKEIESAIATADPGQIVELRSESEELHAFAAEMRYFCPTPESGARTTLKGSPVHALRQGHRIECPELDLKGADKNGNGQQIFAKGRGHIDLLDKQTGKHSVHIHWRTSLTSTKDKETREGDRVFDLLTLRDDVLVIDDERNQELRAGQFLHLWLEEVKNVPGARPETQANTSRDPGGGRHRPHRLEAFENVSVRSPELIIRKTSQLTICFREMTPVGEMLPAAASGSKATPAQPVALPGPGGSSGSPAMLLPPVQKVPSAAAPLPPKKQIPIELTGDKITAYVASIGNKKELLELVADENVHVHQDPPSPKEKGLEITGSTLTLKRKPKGDILHVFGESRKLAQLQFNEMLLFGHNVTIDQVENMAIVEGQGALNMPSNKTLDGKPKETRITIHWNKSMWFNGRSADFDGGVEAFQDTGKVRCQGMQVTLDKPVDFKQGQKSGNKPAVDKIVCHGRDDQPVYLTDEEITPTGKKLKYQRLQLAVVEVDNVAQRMNGSGPGVLDHIGNGGPGSIDGSDPVKSPEKTSQEVVLKWTRVRFVGQLISFPTPNGSGRQTIFTDQVRVFHQLGEDPNIRDPITLGKDGLYLTCQKLNIVSRKIGERTSQEMIAEGGTGLVNFQTNDFHGNAKTVKYDERQELIIFDGAPATVYVLPKVQGGEPRTIQGRNILYNKKTGEFRLEGVRVISS